MDVERAVLGAALKSAEAHARTHTELVAEDFTIDVHRVIFAGMCRLYDKGIALDPITLADELGPESKTVGGIPFLTELMIETVTAANIEHHIQIMRESSKRRMFLADMTDIVNALKEGEDGYLERTQAAVERAQGKVASSVSMVGDCVIEAFTEICEGRQRGLETGFVVLDQNIGGLNKGHVCIVAGRPSMGKTSFAANIAANVAMTGKSVAFFSLEQPKKDVVKRMLISLSKCTEYDAHKGYRKPLTRLAEAMESVSKWNMSIVDDAYTLEKIRECCYSLKRKTKSIDLVVIDYLGLIKTKGRKNGTREQEVSELSRNIKLLARELDCPIILLSQLSRAPEQRTDHQPILADLRESGSIEQDADEVIFLYRPAVYDSRADGKEAIIHVAKNRNGATGGIRAEWDGETFTYSDVVMEEVTTPEWEDI